MIPILALLAFFWLFYQKTNDIDTYMWVFKQNKNMKGPLALNVIRKKSSVFCRKKFCHFSRTAQQKFGRTVQPNQTFGQSLDSKCFHLKTIDENENIKEKLKSWERFISCPFPAKLSWIGCAIQQATFKRLPGF